MSNLHDLLKSLVTVCVSYHHEKTGLRDAIEPTIHTLLKKSSSQIETQLTELIAEAVKVDKTRESFLNYVLFEIKGILTFLALSEIPKEEDMVGLQMQISQFLQCTQKLLETSQGTELQVTYNNQEVGMHGFVRRTLWTSWSLCGNTIQAQLFTPFRLATTTRKEEMDSFVREIFQTHCRDLLVIRLTHRNEALQNELDAAQEAVQKEQAKLEAAKAKISQLEKELDKPQAQKAVSAVRFSGPLYPGLFAGHLLLNTGIQVGKSVKQNEGAAANNITTESAALHMD